MRRILTSIIILGAILSVASSVHAQVDDAALANWLKVYKASTTPDERLRTFTNPGLYVSQLKPVLTAAMHSAEVARIDKQTSAPAASAGSTSAVSKGSVPWLFSLAAEHGALTQSVSGNLITMQGSPANVIIESRII